MLGSIIGDIVGSIYEFNNRKEHDFEPFIDEECCITDDSILTCAVAEWLLEDDSRDAKTLEDTIVKYCRRYPHPMGGYGNRFSDWLFDYNNLYDYSTQSTNATGHRIPYYSCGNGSAMRVSAVGWACDDEVMLLDIAARSAEVTHNHPEGIKGAQATAMCIFLARKGKTPTEIQEVIEQQFGYDLSLTVDEIRPRYSWQGLDGRIDGGTCQGSVPQAISCALQAKDFEDAIRNAVSIGGDSDTIACITGGIAEALFGIPESFIREVVSGKMPRPFVHLIHKFAQKYNVGHLNEYFRHIPTPSISASTFAI